MKVAVIDYGANNLFSLMSGLAYLDHDPVLVGSHSDFQSNFDAVVLPGVGAFGAGMAELVQRGLVGPIQDYAAVERPLIGICLGAQLLLDSSEEFGESRGLGILAGTVQSLKKYGVATPAVGWSQVTWVGPKILTESSHWMYFVHSYAMMPQDDNDVVARTERNGYSYAAAVGTGAVLGLQFHPEKSGITGLKFLDLALRQEMRNE